jgi:HSP20 family protein
VSPLYLQRHDLGSLYDLERVSDELRDFLTWLDESQPDAPACAEYRPPIDVVETAESIDIVADLPGVTTDALRIVFAGGAVVVAGRKAAPTCDHRGTTFHLAERTFGRFACVVRLAVAVDAGRARATFRAGELHLRLPRIEDRRGRDIRIEIESA